MTDYSSLHTIDHYEITIQGNSKDSEELFCIKIDLSTGSSGGTARQ